MKICKECGCYIPIEWKVCPSCGCNIDINTDIQSTNKIIIENSPSYSVKVYYKNNNIRKVYFNSLRDVMLFINRTNYKISKISFIKVFDNLNKEIAFFDKKGLK